MKKIILIIGVLLIIYFIVQLFIFSQKIKTGRKIAKNTEPFSHLVENPNKRILIIGDSTAYGTGAKSPDQSTAGYFHQDFPDAEIINISKNGAKTDELTEMIQSATGKFNIVIIQAGANDIIYFTPLEKARENMNSLLQESKKLSDNIVLLTSGNIGSAPIFFPPLSWFYEYRARRYLNEFKKIADKNQVAVVDLWLKKKDDIFRQNIEKYYAADHLHLSEEGYKLWYNNIRQTIEKTDINL